MPSGEKRANLILVSLIGVALCAVVALYAGGWTVRCFQAWWETRAEMQTYRGKQQTDGGVMLGIMGGLVTLAFAFLALVLLINALGTMGVKLPRKPEPPKQPIKPRLPWMD